MSLPPVALWFDDLRGYSAQPTDTLRQGNGATEFVTVSNLIPDPVGDLITVPGFSKVRSNRVQGAGKAITGMFHMGPGLAEEFIVWSDDGKPYRDNADPPGAIAGGTNFTAGVDVIVRGDIFQDFLICVSSSRDLPQTFTSAVARADLGGTPPRGIDYKVFGRRGWMFAPSVAGTIYRHLASFNDVNDNQASWVNPVTTNFLNFGRAGTGVNVLGGELFRNYLCVFTEDAVFPVYVTPTASFPFAFQQPLFSEKGGGPPAIESVISAAERLFWVSKNFDVKMLDWTGQVKSIGFPVQPFLRGLNDARRVNLKSGFEPRYRLVQWAVSNGSDTTNKTILTLHVDTLQFGLLTRSRNCFAKRTVSGQQRLIGGGYDGYFYNELDSSTTGNLDDSTALIDADLITPRYHLGMPGVKKKVPYWMFEFDPIGAETVTLSFRKDDAATWVDRNVAITGTDIFRARLRTPGMYERIEFRIRDNLSGERYRLLRFGSPKPVAVVTTAVT